MNSLSPEDLLIALFYQENETVKIISHQNTDKNPCSLTKQFSNHSNTIENKILTDLLLTLEKQEDVPIHVLESLGIMLNFLSDLDTLNQT